MATLIDTVIEEPLKAIKPIVTHIVPNNIPPPTKRPNVVGVNFSISDFSQPREIIDTSELLFPPVFSTSLRKYCNVASLRTSSSL